jgi:uncharacterized protein
MAITADRVREIFRGLESGDGSIFFKHVAEDVDWFVMGTHPLAGHDVSKKAFIDGTFAKLAKVLPQGTELHTENVIVQGDQAVVELHSLEASAWSLQPHSLLVAISEDNMSQLQSSCHVGDQIMRA